MGAATADQVKKVFDIMKDRDPPPLEPPALPDKPRANIMFWHSHHHFSTLETGAWGLRLIDQSRLEFHEYALVPLGEGSEGKTDLYDKYRWVLGGGG